MGMHTMKLRPEPFGKIAAELKTIELRLYDAKRRQVQVGDTIRFVCTADGAEVTAEVLALHRFPSFAELYRCLPLTACGYTEAELPHARPEDMARYYDAEEQSRYGVVGIEIKLI